MTFLGSCAKGRRNVVKEPLQLLLLFWAFLFPSDKKARRVKVSERSNKNSLHLDHNLGSPQQARGEINKQNLSEFP